MTHTETLKLALAVLIAKDTYGSSIREAKEKAIAAIKEALAQPEGCQCLACKVTPHASDCAVHSEPAYPNGECNCGAQPKQEPVANIRTWHKNGEQHAELWNWDKGIETLPDGDHDLYTTPPQRKPLTDEEIVAINDKYYNIAYRDFEADVAIARAIEQAHGIKE